VEDFYLGGIAKKIHRDMRAHNGLLHLDDLSQIPHPIERKPLSGRFEGHRFLTFPPPGAGRTLVEMFHILEEFAPQLRNIDTPKGAVLLSHVIRQAFIDRRDRPFDPTFYQQIDDQRMMSKRYAELVAKRIRRQIKSSGETTHLSVMDKAGNAVALTQSIERVYGSFSAAPDLGFLYNNYMSCFETEDISHPYYLRPNAAPWASVAPTIGFRGRKPWLVIGSPGSQRITPAIVQVLLRLKNQSPFDAVEAPRLHCSLDGKVSLEVSRMRSDIPEALERAGFELDLRDPYSFYLGCVQLVIRDRNTFTGFADLRRDGSAAGPKIIPSLRANSPSPSPIPTPVSTSPASSANTAGSRLIRWLPTATKARPASTPPSRTSWSATPARPSVPTRASNGPTSAWAISMARASRRAG
jgi:gamma-glutamyltranspeptidase/glutathione hydrolase